MPKQLFLSYSTDDTTTATEVRDHLEAAGIACWMAPRDITPGLDYGTQIIDAIEACTVLVLVLSESSNRSRFVLSEVERAVSKGKIIIPFRVQEVKPSRSLEFFISNAQWIDAWQTPLRDKVALLASALRGHLPALPSAPPLADLAMPPVTLTATPSSMQLPANRRSNLPAPSTPFIGRETELVEIARQLADPACRLLTLAGHGGIGKTRLSLEIARNIFVQGIMAPDGVFFVPLEALTAATQIPYAIAQALDLSFAGQRDAQDLLLAFLAEKELLLVLDNFEHLLEGADLVADILAAAPAVTILVTSREALNLQEEWFHPISGLDLPPADGPSVHEALGYGAVQLFAQCARRARPTFDLKAELGSVVQLCRMVDGMPLALELAAAWLRSLTCAQIVQELQSNLQLLSTSMRNMPQRHRSMEAVFTQSWQLLDQSARNSLCQLAVFEGGFDWAAAKAVSGVTMPTLMRLVDSSWLQVREEGRYDLVPLVRSYLLARLDDDYAATAREAANRVRDRHSRYYAAQLFAMTAKEREQNLANLRTSWRHALAHFDGEGFFNFVAQMLDKLLLRKGWADFDVEAEELLAESERRLRAEMTASSSVVHSTKIHRALAQLLFQRAVASNRAGLGQKAEAYCREGLAALERLGEREVREFWRVQALETLAWILIGQSKLQDADATALQALTACRDGVDWENQAYALHYLAYSAEEQGHFAEARAHLRRALELLPAGRVVDFIDLILISRLGSVSYMMGDYTQATEWWGKTGEIQQVAPRLQRVELQIFWARLDSVLGDLLSARTRCQNALPIAREHGLRQMQVFALNELGNIALHEGQLGEAESYYLEAQQIAEYIGRRKEIARSWIGLGNVKVATTAFSEAAASFRQALAIVWPLGILPESIDAIIGLAEVAAHTGNGQRASSWLRMVVAHAATPHHIRLHAEHALAHLEENGDDMAERLEDIVASVLPLRANEKEGL